MSTETEAQRKDGVGPQSQFTKGQSGLHKVGTKAQACRQLGLDPNLVTSHLDHFAQDSWSP